MSAALKSRTNIIPLKPRKGKQYAPDSVFFTKEQIKVGTVLIHVGRLDPSAWTVTRIITHSPRREAVPTVRSFSDHIYMRRANGLPPMRRSTFGYLCYSAVWRVG